MKDAQKTKKVVAQKTKHVLIVRPRKTTDPTDRTFGGCVPSGDGGN